MTFKFLYALENLATCDDPGTPVNGKRRVVSFAHNQVATFDCNEGYEQEGTRLRTYLMSNSGKTYWSGFPTVCKGMKTLTSMFIRVNTIIVL